MNNLIHRRQIMTLAIHLRKKYNSLRIHVMDVSKELIDMANASNEQKEVIYDLICKTDLRTDMPDFQHIYNEYGDAGLSFAHMIVRGMIKQMKNTYNIETIDFWNERLEVMNEALDKVSK